MGFYPHMYAEQCTKKFLHTHLGHMLLLHTRWNDPHLQLLVLSSHCSPCSTLHLQTL